MVLMLLVPEHLRGFIKGGIQLLKRRTSMTVGYPV
jgi:hypothetical protein